MANNTLWRQPSLEPQDFDQYGNPTGGPTESKREKRRRDMVDRVSRLHADTLERRDQVYHDLSEIFARTAEELLPPPVFPTFDLSTPVGQLPPSLPFTDPVIPDMHPTPYLFALHRLSLQRANHLLAVRLYHANQVSIARKLYEAEVERIEDEYEGATKNVVERLLEGVEERKKRLMDEKDGDGLNLDAFLDPQRAHGTRRVRGGAPNRVHSSRPHPSVIPGAAEATTEHSAFTSSLLGISTAADPFHLASSLLPSSSNGPLLTAISGIGPTATLLNGVSKRKPGVRPQPGLPPANFTITIGSYQLFGKSVQAIGALRGDEIDGDLGEVRRKRARTGNNGGGRRRGFLD